MLPGQPTYETQWQKITSAYVNNTLKPYNECACFIGNLLNGKGAWGMCRDWDFEMDAHLIPGFPGFTEAINFIKKESRGLYTPQQIVDMENNFLNVYAQYGNEASLYEAMTSTLELLRQIHLANGDETAIEIPLTKRQLQPA